MPEYLLNCFWLLVPVLVFNLLFARHLPPAFQPERFDRAIPRALARPENVLRTLVMLLPLLMRLRLASPNERLGGALYLFGVLVYFASWGVLILAPRCAWSASVLGFMAPAYTPAIWLVGIGLMGGTLVVSNARLGPWPYCAVSALFLVFHNLHAYRAYAPTT
jgi:hypothetical protein